MLQQELYNNIFRTSGQDNTSLTDIVREFPYFSLAHVYLLKETQLSDVGYDLIAGRTALHFNNPFYLNDLLNQNEARRAKLNVDLADQHAEETNVPELLINVPATSIHDEKSEDLIFEPLYTTDYFASQGIKLSEEIKADDKLGKQLKSFTDWLKTMKKVHDQKLPPGSEQADIAVQNIAEKSNTGPDIITESMAEVYLNQGKPGKARDIYNKLSLLDPAKSAYFAAKIELLKEK